MDGQHARRVLQARKGGCGVKTRRSKRPPFCPKTLLFILGVPSAPRPCQGMTHLRLRRALLPRAPIPSPPPVHVVALACSLRLDCCFVLFSIPSLVCILPFGVPLVVVTSRHHTHTRCSSQATSGILQDDTRRGARRPTEGHQGATRESCRRSDEKRKTRKAERGGESIRKTCSWRLAWPFAWARWGLRRRLCSSLLG